MIANCLFDKKKPCPLAKQHIPLNDMGRFCQACSAQQMLTIKKLIKETKVMKAGLIVGMLQMFPNDEKKAKAEYQKLMKRVEEW